jgi:uncharacterized membrane protein YqjE
MINRITSLISWILFIASFIIAGIALWEKLANLIGLTLTRGYYTNMQLLEFSVIALLFVIAIQLWEIKRSIAAKGS